MLIVLSIFAVHHSVAAATLQFVSANSMNVLLLCVALNVKVLRLNTLISSKLEQDGMVFKKQDIYCSSKDMMCILLTAGGFLKCISVHWMISCILHCDCLYCFTGHGVS